MVVCVYENTCAVNLELCDGRIRNESDVFHRMKVILKAQGYDLIKKCPGKDGHLTGAPFYLRARNLQALAPGALYCIDDLNQYAVRDLAADLRKFGEVTLSVRRVSANDVADYRTARAQQRRKGRARTQPVRAIVVPTTP